MLDGRAKVRRIDERGEQAQNQERGDRGKQSEKEPEGADFWSFYVCCLAQINTTTGVLVCPDYSVVAGLIMTRRVGLWRMGDLRLTGNLHAILVAVKGAANGQIAMIFDLDGVLVHSMPLHVLAWEEYLQSLGIHIEDVERRMHGKRNPELVRELISNDLAEDIVLEHGAAKERLFREMLVKSELAEHGVPGITEFLERHKEIPKAIGSNAEPANIDFVLDRFALRAYFPVVVDGFQVSRPKPFPDIYLRGAELLGVAPRSCIVFEDSPTGIEAARAAGMRVVGVETTPTDFVGVDLHVKDFLDPKLEPWIEAQQAA